MKPSIDLVFSVGCPRVEAARDALRLACALAGRSVHWREWRSDDPALPSYAVGYGSPTIFIGGRELIGADPGEPLDGCRLYRGDDGAYRPAPDPERIAAALTRGIS